MRPPRSIIVLGGWAVLLGGCGRPASQAPPAAAGEGRAAYVALMCGSCHGQSRQGSPTAPPLRGLAAHWSEEALVAYLRDPLSARAGNPRLEELARRWSSDMPPVQVKDEARLRVLARYLLESP